MKTNEFIFALIAVLLMLAPVQQTEVFADKVEIGRLSRDAVLICQLNSAADLMESLENLGEFNDLLPELLSFSKPGVQLRKKCKLDVLVSLKTPCHLVVHRGEGSLPNFSIVVSGCDSDSEQQQLLNAVKCLGSYTSDFLLNCGASQNLANQLKVKLDSLAVASKSGITVVSSSPNSLEYTLSTLDSDAKLVQPSRSWLAATKSAEQDVDIFVFWNYRAAKKLLIDLKFFTVETWKTQRVDTTPWVTSTASIFPSGEGFRVETATSYRSTIPLEGPGKYLEMYSPISSYVDVPKQAVSYSIESFDLNSLNQFNKNNFDLTFGEGSLERLDAFTKFEMGFGREQLGNTAVRIHYGPRHKSVLRLYSLESNSVNFQKKMEAVLSHLNELKRSPVTNYGVDKYLVTDHEENPIIWDFKLTDRDSQRRRKMAWLASQDSMEMPREIPDDFNVPKTREVFTYFDHQSLIKANESYGDRHDDSEPFSGLESGFGGVLSSEWLVIGDWFQVNSVMDWEKNGVWIGSKLKIGGSTDYFDRALARSKGKPFHFVKYENKSVCLNRLQRRLNLIGASLGSRGRMSAATLAEIKKDAGKISMLTDAQRIRFSLGNLTDKLTARNPSYLETHFVNDFKNLLTVQASWNFSN